MKILLCLLVLFLFSCDSEKDKNISVTTFNIAWLGDGFDDEINRNKHHYNLLSELINEISSDVIALQEIENIYSLNKLKLDEEYNILISDKPEKQKTALLIKKNIKIINYFSFNQLSLGVERLRPGLIAYCKINDFDFYVGSFHFKSTSRYDDTPEKKQLSYMYREKQSKILANWIDSVSIEQNENDYILLGDFNDNPLKKNTKINALDNDNLNFLTSNLNSCKFEYLNTIDHIIVSNSVKNNIIENSLFMTDITNMFNDEEIKYISDHCPVSVKINLPLIDND